MTFLEWPIVARGLAWGKRLYGAVRGGAATVGHLAALDARMAPLEKLSADLAVRLTALEKSLETRPPDLCDTCGHYAMRRSLVGGLQGATRIDRWQCAECQTIEVRVVRF